MTQTNQSHNNESENNEEKTAPLSKESCKFKPSYQELEDKIKVLNIEIESLQKQLKSEENKVLSSQHEIKRINNAFEHSMNQLRAAAEHNATAVNIINNLQQQNDDLYSRLGTAQTEINILTQTLSQYYYEKQEKKRNKANKSDEVKLNIDDNDEYYCKKCLNITTNKERNEYLMNKTKAKNGHKNGSSNHTKSIIDNIEAIEKTLNVEL